MPTEKFMNLGDYKKQAILDAMRAEFMTTHYSEIRISSLIKRAGISRASFYLYFTIYRRLALQHFAFWQKPLFSGRAPHQRFSYGPFKQIVHIMINGKGDEKNAHREIHESG